MSHGPSSDPIVFTGSGLVCGAGGSVDEVWQALAGGESAIAPYTRWDGAAWSASRACEVALSPRELVPDRKLHKSISLTDLFGIYAAERAIDASGLIGHRESLDESEHAAFNDRTGIIAGSGGGVFSSNYDFLPLMTAVGNDLPGFGRELGNHVTPMWLLKNLPNNVLCHVGIRAQFKGTNACITNQCASGIMAAAESAAAILNGEADRLVAVGHDAPIEPEMVHYYHQLGLMDPETPRPFDRTRGGTVFGEGAAALVLERESAARARGAGILGRFLGFGCCSEATGILELDPDGDGVRRAVEEALAMAGLQPSDVGMVCAHGNGTPASDLTEALGLRSVFGEAIPPVTSFKWAYGHLIAVSGLIDLVMVLETLRRGRVPGVATFAEIDPAIDFLPVVGPGSAVAPESPVALVVCRGFGGMNVAALVETP